MTDLGLTVFHPSKRFLRLFLFLYVVLIGSVLSGESQAIAEIRSGMVQAFILTCNDVGSICFGIGEPGTSDQQSGTDSISASASWHSPSGLGQSRTHLSPSGGRQLSVSGSLPISVSPLGPDGARIKSQALALGAGTLIVDLEAPRPLKLKIRGFSQLQSGGKSAEGNASLSINSRDASGRVISIFRFLTCEARPAGPNCSPRRGRYFGRFDL